MSNLWPELLGHWDTDVERSSCQDAEAATLREKLISQRISRPSPNLLVRRTCRSSYVSSGLFWVGGAGSGRRNGDGSREAVSGSYEVIPVSGWFGVVDGSAEGHAVAVWLCLGSDHPEICVSW